MLKKQIQQIVGVIVPCSGHEIFSLFTFGATSKTPAGHFEHTAQHLIMIAVLLIGYYIATYCPLEHTIFHSTQTAMAL